MKTAAIFVAAAGLVAAKPTLLNSSYDVTTGSYEISISGCPTGCTITLENGPSDDLKPVKTLSSDAKDGKVTVDIGDVPTDTYAFRIRDNSDPTQENFSPQFEIEGSGSPSTTEATTTAPATTTSAQETTTSAEETTSAESSTEASSTAEETTSAESSSSVDTTMTTMTTPSGATPTPTSSGQGSSTTEDSQAPTEVPDSGVGRLASPLALVAGAIGAMIFFN